MAQTSARSRRKGIAQLWVEGFKSISPRTTIAIRPLTILAGANSSGKSSMFQPLMLLKQTLEAPFDPGPLLLNGPNVRFTSSQQLLTRAPGVESRPSFTLGLALEDGSQVELELQRIAGKKGFRIARNTYTTKDESYVLTPRMNYGELEAAAGQHYREIKDKLKGEDYRLRLSMKRDRAFLTVSIRFRQQGFTFPLIDASDWFSELRRIIHVPGLRGNPERTYVRSAVGRSFPGTFDQYVASIIAGWQTPRNRKHLDKLGEWLQCMGLTVRVLAQPINDTQVELRVARTSSHSTRTSRDTVNIADVGFGVSQVLPVLVALQVAEPGQMVYIEQPEIHLHPRAQVELAKILVSSARSGIKTVVETHSSVMLRAIQVAIASKAIDKGDVALHWFHRDMDSGLTHVDTAKFDALGTYGETPVDFEVIALHLESSYLDSVEEQLLKSAEDKYETSR